MARGRSFTEYVASRFYNELYSAIQCYIKDNEKGLNWNLRKVRNIGEISLSDFDIKSISINDLPDMKIQFDVIADAEIEVSEGDYHYDNLDICYQWFQLRCSGDLACNLDDFGIASIDTYNQKNKMIKPLSDSLVPYIRKEDLEDTATDFLRRNYPKALLTPMAIEPKELAENMGLTVVVQEITKDFSVFGQIFFQDCEAELYNTNQDAIINTHVQAGTIIVDPKAFFLRNLGAVNNTIVHECVHWDKHRKAFELERLYNSNLNKIKCQVVGGIKDSTREANSWMEWQANALAPRIQMPLGMFKKRIEQLISQYRRELHTYDMIDIIEPIIDELAISFGVSRVAAKIRMIDAGYEEATGAFIYIDGKYVKPHKAKKGYLERNKTFSIGSQDAGILSLTNQELRSAIESGRYQYVDSHFVLNHPLYVEFNEEGNLHLTHYARNHMDECCLLFELSVKTNFGDSYHSECFLNRDKCSTVDFNVTFHDGYENAPTERQIRLIRETMLEENKIYEELPNNFIAALNKVIDWRNQQIKEEKKNNPNKELDKITAAEISRRTGLHEATVRRTIKDGDTSLNTLVLICLALHLPYKISKHIIDHSPTPLRLSNDTNMWYDFVLQHHYAKTVDEVKKILQDYGADPL